MPNIGVFFDRDDTLNYDPGYLGNPDKVELIPGVAEGLKNLKKQLNCKIIVISNQSGIARGLITENDVHSVNNKLNELTGNLIDGFYFCPFHPEFDPPEKSNCRKPSPEMIHQAAREHKIDLGVSYLVGDVITDMLCGANAGVKTILFNWKNSVGIINGLKKQGKTPNLVVHNFIDACNFIIEDLSGGN